MSVGGLISELKYVAGFFFVALQPNAGHGLLILEFSRSHTTTHHSRQDSSGRVISSSQRPLFDNTQHSQQTNIHAPSGIRTNDLSRRVAAELRLRPLGHWDRHMQQILTYYINMLLVQIITSECPCVFRSLLKRSLLKADSIRLFEASKPIIMPYLTYVINKNISSKRQQLSVFPIKMYVKLQIINNQYEEKIEYRFYVTAQDKCCRQTETFNLV